MFIRLILILALIMTLSDCCGNWTNEDCPALSPGYCKPPAACGCLEKDPDLLCKVRHHQIQIERMGDNVLLILPSDHFFYGKSTHLNPNSYPALCDVIALINCFEKMEVRVVAYTDNGGCVEENNNLSRQQATNLASYLWQHGLDARFVYPAGNGQYCPIANPCDAKGRSQNRRIEITLTHLPPQVSGE